MRGIIQAILDMDSWQSFWNMVDMPLPGDPAITMTSRLRQCWTASLARGYHKEVRLFATRSPDDQSQHVIAAVILQRIY